MFRAVNETTAGTPATPTYQQQPEQLGSTAFDPTPTESRAQLRKGTSEKTVVNQSGLAVSLGTSLGTSLAYLCFPASMTMFQKTTVGPLLLWAKLQHGLFTTE